MGCKLSKSGHKSYRAHVKEAIRLNRRYRQRNEREIRAETNIFRRHLRQESIDNKQKIISYSDILEEILKANEMKQLEKLMRSHGKTLLQNLNQLRLQGKHVDVNLLSKEGSIFPCHRVVVSAASVTLREKCIQGDGDGTQGLITIDLDDVDTLSLKNVLEYIYTGQCELTHDSEPTTNAAAISLRIESLQAFCYSAKVFLTNNINRRATWKNFHEDYVVSFLKELQMLQHTGKFVDVRVENMDRVIACHRCILTSCSGFFRAMFTTDFSDSKSEVVRLHEIDTDSVEMLVDFSYTGQVCFNSDTAESLLTVANQLHWDEVEQLGTAFLESQMDETNCLGISRFAESCGYPELSVNAKRFALDNFHKITSEVDFLELDFDYLKGLFSEYMLIDSEEVMLDAVFRWIRHDPTNRSKHIQELIDLISVQDLEDETIVTLTKLFPYIDLSGAESNNVSRKSRYYKQVMVFFGSNEMDERQRNIEIYNPTTKKWTVMSKLPSQADSFVSSVVSMGKDIWLSTLKRSTWIYSTQTDEWKQVRSQPGRRLTQYGAVFHGGYVYIIGGNEDTTNVVKETVDRYDPKTDSWSMMAPLLSAVGTRAVITWRDYFYVFGGWDGQRYTHDVQRYDIGTNEWKFVSRCPVRDTHGIAAVVLGDYIYVLESGELYRYNPQTDTWRKMQSMNDPRSDFNTVVYKGVIHVMGGLHNGHTVTSVEVYNEEMDCWETIEDLDDVTIFAYPRCVCVLRKNVHNLLYKYNRSVTGFRTFELDRSVSNYSISSTESVTSSLAMIM